MSYDFIFTIAIGLMFFGVGYSLGHKRALIKALMDPRHDCIFAVFYLFLLKKLDEKDYDAVRGGIQMQARQYVLCYRMNEKRLSKHELRKLKENTKYYELIENAEELCGSLEPVDIDEMIKNYGISE